jgi:hypothetical protein
MNSSAPENLVAQARGKSTLLVAFYERLDELSAFRTFGFERICPRRCFDRHHYR